MEFNCPSCDAPHAFPDEQIPADGIVVACTSCATHITLDPPASAPPPAEPEPEPPVEEPKPTLRAGDVDAVQMDAPAPRPSINAPMTGMDGGAPSFREKQDSRPPPRPKGWPAPPKKKEGEKKPRVMPRPMDDSDPPAPIADLDDPAPAPASAPVPAPEPAPGPSRKSRPPTPAPQPAPSAPAPEPEPEPSDMFDRVAGAAKDIAGAGINALDEVSARAQAPEDDVPDGLAFPGFKPAAGGLFTWRDLPRAFLGLVDVQRLGFATAVLWVAMLAVGVINWLGALLAEKVWGHLGTAFGVVGWVVLVAAVLFVTSVIGYVCHQTVVEQRSSSIKQGVDWTQKWIKSVFGTPLAFLAVIAAIAAFHGIVGGIGRIPYVGPIVWGLLSGVTIVSALAAGVVAVVLGYTLGLYIPVVYNEKTGPADTLKRLLELARGHGANLVALVIASVAMIAAAFWAILKPAIFIGTFLLSYVGLKAMGAEDLILTIASNPFAAIGQATGVVFEQLGGGFPGEPNIGHKLGGFFTAFFATGAVAFVMSLLYIPYVTAGGIIYSVLTGRKKP